jgi:hypothetical protein
MLPDSAAPNPMAFLVEPFYDAALRQAELRSYQKSSQLPFSGVKEL